MMRGIYRPATTPHIPLHEMLRYAGMPKCENEDLLLHAKRVAQTCEEKMQPVLAYRSLGIVSIAPDGVLLEDGVFLTGRLVAKYLSGCSGACILVGTVGLQVDRMIAAYAYKTSLDGLLADAAGSAAIEAVMDDFCDRIPRKCLPKPRISPGYGDFPLENQRVIFSLLDAPKVLGTCLNNSLLISPSKSVSAVVGLDGEHYV